MSLSASQIQKVLAEIKEAVQGGFIDKVRQRTEDSLVLTVKNKGRPLRLLISASRYFPRIHSLSTSPPSQFKSPFIDSLRKRIERTLIERIEQQPAERVVVLGLFRRGEEGDEASYRLIAELTPPHSNLILLDEEDTIVSCIRNFRGQTRKISAGEKYVPLRAASFRRIEVEDDLEALAAQLGSYNLAVERHFSELELQHELDSIKADAAKALRSQLQKTRRLVAKLQATEEESKEAEATRLKGELLKANMHRVQKGMRELTVENVFEPSAGEVTIKLEPRLSPAENLERYFKTYRKLKAVAAAVASQLAAAREREALLEESARGLEAAASPEEVESILQSARDEALLPQKKPAKPRRKPKDPLAPTRFISADGFDLLIGRNKLQNDHLVLHLARGNDLWLHVQGAEGPHVVLRVPREKSVPPDTLLDAANLAIHFSKLRKSGSGHVDYTQCKNVRKPKGSPPGYVTFFNNKSIYLTLDPIRLERIFQTKH